MWDDDILFTGMTLSRAQVQAGGAFEYGIFLWLSCISINAYNQCYIDIMKVALLFRLHFFAAIFRSSVHSPQSLCVTARPVGVWHPAHLAGLFVLCFLFYCCAQYIIHWTLINTKLINPTGDQGQPWCTPILCALDRLIIILVFRRARIKLPFSFFRDILHVYYYPYLIIIL